jgi:hypothetical protein
MRVPSAWSCSRNSKQNPHVPHFSSRRTLQSDEPQKAQKDAKRLEQEAIPFFVPSCVFRGNLPLFLFRRRRRLDGGRFERRQVG